MSLKSRCCENPCGIKTCRGCDTCRQAHFAQQHAAALYHLEHAHRALEQLDTGMFEMPDLAKKAYNAVKGGVAVVKDRVQQLKIAYQKHVLENLRSKLALTTDVEEIQQLNTQIHQLEQEINTLQAAAGTITPPAATIAPPAGTITQTAQMRTNPYCLG